MLKKNNKVLFNLLLIPFYINLMIIFFWISTSSSLTGVMWTQFFISTVANVSAAWMISLNKKIWVNIAGLIFYTVYGSYYIYYVLNDPQIGLWQVNMIFGIIIILIGVSAFVYEVIKYKRLYS